MTRRGILQGGAIQLYVLLGITLTAMHRWLTKRKELTLGALSGATRWTPRPRRTRPPHGGGSGHRTRTHASTTGTVPARGASWLGAPLRTSRDQHGPVGTSASPART